MSVLLLLGSSRRHGNGVGISAWLEALLRRDAVGAVTALDMHTAPLPLGPVDEDTMPALVTDPALYEKESVRAWSRVVSASAGVVIVTPQYNWGYPGELKNALDHLYWEWRGKPVLLVTYGSHGGNKCAEHLKPVLEGSLKMRVVAELAIKLPEAYVRSDARIGGSHEAEVAAPLLAPYADAAAASIRTFLAAAAAAAVVP